MTLQIEAAETPAAVILVFDLDGDFRSRRLRAGVDRIGIVADQIRRLRLRAANLAGRLH